MGWTKNFGDPQGAFGRLILKSMNLGHTPISRWGLAHYAWQPDTAALDIGCGGGANLRRMLRLSPQGTVCGIDISQESVICSKKRNLAQLGRRCTVKRAGAEKIPFAAGQFDVVTAFETVYFWPDVPRAFAEAFRVLKPGGTFLVVCESADPNSGWKDFCEGMNIYSPPQLEAALRAAGFVSIETDWPHRANLCISGKKPV